MDNSLKYVKILESVGVSREQAEAHVQLITEVMEGDLATKQDIINLEKKIDTSMQLLEYRMTIKLGTIVTVAITIAMAVFTAVVKLL